MGQIRDDILLNIIVEKLKTLRQSKGVTQEEIYNDTDIHIGRIESRKVNITVSTLSKLCDYFEISLATFFKEIKR
ncbi:MAG: helix-turn-helix transcriptional regulator [Ferruginibacter sp.]